MFQWVNLFFLRKHHRAMYSINYQVVILNRGGLLGLSKLDFGVNLKIMAQLFKASLA